MMDISFHYPPELLQLLKDVLPKLCKSKRDLLLFFKGAGVSAKTLSPHEKLLTTDKAAFNKYHVAREVLTSLNEQGEASLRARREVLKRVTEFEDFSVCWSNDQAAARGLVAQIRDLVNVKDSFTRMRIEKDDEQRKRIELQRASAKADQLHKAEQERIKAELFSLFAESDAHRRGKSLERLLNDMFAIQGMSVREAFTIKGECGEGVIEQIDGLVDVDGHLYLVEMKWWNTPIGVREIAPHLVRVFSRGGQARGLFISYSNFTDPAIAQCRDAIAKGAVVILATLEEIVSLVNAHGDLKAWLKTKLDCAIADKQPFVLRLS